MNVLIVILIFSSSIINLTSAKSHSTCNDECLTKTYCLSSDESNVCSKNNLVTAKWFVVPQNDDEDAIALTLTGQGIKSTDEKTISLTFQTPNSPSQEYTTYSCYKSPLGSTKAEVDTGPTRKVIQGGSSYYSNNVLSCTWTLIEGSDIYPLNYYQYINLISDPDYQLVLRDDDKPGITVAFNTSELPIYHMNYMKCCNKVHGNDDYLIFFNQTKDNQYLINTLTSQKPGKLTLSLIDGNGIQLLFNCNFETYIISSTIGNSTEWIPISEQIYGERISDFRCLWSHPLYLSSSFGRYDTNNVIYDVQLTADNKIVYTEKGVSLRNSSPKLLSTTSIFIMIISLLLNYFM